MEVEKTRKIQMFKYDSQTLMGWNLQFTETTDPGLFTLWRVLLVSGHVAIIFFSRGWKMCNRFAHEGSVYKQA